MPGKWTDSNRRSRLPDDWPKLVAQTKKRAQGRCQKRLPSGKQCPRPGTDVDHIRPGDDHRAENLQLLCTDHHAAKSSREGNGARWGKKKIRPRTEGRHPGEIG